jgi:hypothetical protein
LLNLRILLCAVQHAFICYLHICSSLPFINIHNKEILFACQIIKERVIQLCNQRIDRSSVEYDLTEIADICNDIFYEENDDENQNHGKSHHYYLLLLLSIHITKTHPQLQEENISRKRDWYVFVLSGDKEFHPIFKENAGIFHR